ncbi:MAG: metal ABC transporter ATP-binding protein [Treponema sp.]|jgi:zinc transport system ATP-binding protein|nr:metal ABC transporter ATP-binding protein [Treponema sp.]
MTVLTCRNVLFAYEGNTVLRSVNFAVEAGDYLWVVGENGSGKSTLIRGILGLKKPDAGTITLEGGLASREIGYLPQQMAIGQDFPAGVYEVVLSGRLGKGAFRPFYTRRDKQTAEENLARLGIEDLRNRCYRELSGGQQRRVLLARSLCAGSRLLILDEPAAGLDPLVTPELYRLIEKINREACLTVIMVSHDIQGALRYASRILHLKNEQLFFGKPEDYKKSEAGKNFLRDSKND